MDILITVTRSNSRKDPWKRKCIFYVDSNAGNLVDKFFNDNGVWSLNFKSSVWASVKRLASKIDIAGIRKLVGSEASVVYSKNAGCSCGCSSGYLVTKLSTNQYINTDVYVHIESDISHIEKLLPKYKELLDIEIKQHTSK